MKVAQQFIAGKIGKSGSVPVGTIDNDQYFSAGKWVRVAPLERGRREKTQSSATLITYYLNVV
jgi:hypothetical protein